MHKAYNITPLMHLNYQIESITSHDNRLVVGTRQGFLYVYNVSQEEEKCSLVLDRCINGFSKKSIQQLALTPDHLICLTDNVIHLIQMRDLNLKLSPENQITKTKGATLFTLNIKKQTSLTGDISYIILMAVAVKRNLQWYFFKNNSFHLMGETNLKEIPRAMEWCEDTICIGYRGEYVLVSLSENTKESDLFPTSSSRSSEPCIVKASESSFALCRENQTVLVNLQGQTEKTKALRWSSVPVTLAWDEPYALAVLSDNVEVQTLDPCGIVQTITDLTKARFLVRCCQGLIFAASVSQIWAICAVDVDKQRKLLLETKQFQLALKLTEVSNENEEEKKERIHQIQTLLAYDLFANKQFHDSMKEFLKLGTDPYDVIRLFPGLLPQQSTGPEYPEPIKDLTEKELETGLLALIEYLTEMRHRLHSDNNPANVNARGNLNEKVHNKSTQKLLQIIDTTLLKCYLQTNDALVAPLLRLNHCHLAEAEKELKKMGKYNELIILYQTKGQHRVALELLKSENAIERTINYLQHLGSENMGLIIEFASWVLEQSPDDGLKIFIEDLTEVEALPRPRVLDFLLRCHNELVISYLEHVVHVWEDTNHLFHNALIHQYREKAIKEGPMVAEHTRKKLLEFLKKSQHYTPDAVLANFPTNDLIEERAIILGRLGKHEQALTLYVRALGDIQKALDYCEKVYAEKKAGSESLYVTLIKLILDPDSHPLSLPGLSLSPKTAQPDLELALKLLEENASKMNPLEVLQILPDNIGVPRIHNFLLVSLQKVLQERRRVQLLKGLLYAEYLQCREMRLHLQNQSVLVTELNVCQVCKKRFGNQSALIRYPNGDVVHYNCQK